MGIESIIGIVGIVGGIVGVILGVTLQAVITSKQLKQERANQWADKMFEKRLDIYQEFYAKLIQLTSTFGTQIFQFLENDNTKSFDFFENASPIMDYFSEREIYFSKELADDFLQDIYSIIIDGRNLLKEGKNRTDEDDDIIAEFGDISIQKINRYKKILKNELGL